MYCFSDESNESKKAKTLVMFHYIHIHKDPKILDTNKALAACPLQFSAEGTCTLCVPILGVQAKI